MDKKLDLVILGDGSLGQAVYKVIKDAKKTVALWGRNGTTTDPAAGLSELIASTNLIMVCVPSHGFKGLVTEVGEFVKGNQCIVHLARGLDKESRLPMSEVIREKSCVLKIGALSGPVIAEELNSGEPGGAVIASKYKEVKDASKGTLSGAAKHHAVSVPLFAHAPKEH